jgi:hypothetical protein
MSALGRFPLIESLLRERQIAGQHPPVILEELGHRL